MNKTPEEQFEQWYFKTYPNVASWGLTTKAAFIAALRLGQQQGMEEAAKICLNILPHHADGDECAEAIRQAAKRNHLLDAGQFFELNKEKYLEEHKKHCASPSCGTCNDTCAWCNPYEARSRWLASNAKLNGAPETETKTHE